MPKPPTNTLFYVVRTVHGDLEWLQAVLAAVKVKPVMEVKEM